MLEVFVTIKYCFSEEGQQNKTLELFKAYRSVRRHLFYLDIKYGINSWNISKETEQFLEENYSLLDPMILQKLNYKSIEEAKKDVQKLPWLGKISMTKLVKESGTIEQANYEKLCHYVHFSPLPERSKGIIVGFPSWWEEMLIVTVNYVLKSYLLLRESPYVDKKTKEELKDILAKL